MRYAAQDVRGIDIMWARYEGEKNSEQLAHVELFHNFRSLCVSFAAKVN